MNEIGQYSLLLAWFSSVIACGYGIYLALKQSAEVGMIRALTVLATCLLFVSLCSLTYLFLISDFSNQYVWQHSNQAMPWIYKLTAVWGGMDGSMLLWASFLGISTGIVAFKVNKYPAHLKAWLIVVLNSSLIFFLSVVVFFTNPFRYIQSDFIPPDGNGLNPLLQNPYMAIHPPMLYLGFTTFAIPYAFCFAQLLSKVNNNDWLYFTKRWSIIAWAFLTCGIALGGHWAYLELGWGGFWAWDPVENSSFLPWLTGTAFLHSVMVQERKGILKLWNAWLIIGTYALTVFGTFLTRSGIVQSVHAFAKTDIGWIFLAYLALILALAVFLSFYRKSYFQPEKRLESFISREAAFLFNNLIFISICFATFWGVMFPVFSEAITGVKQAVGIPFFNTLNVPLFLILIFLMATGPLIAWRKSNLQQLKRTFLVPLVISFLLGLLLIWLGVEGVYPVIAYSLSFFAILTVFAEYHRGVRAQKEGSYLNKSKQLLNKQRARYGGYLVHIGVAIAAIAITASMAAKHEEEFSLALGEIHQVKRFNLELNEIKETENKNYTGLVAQVTAYTNGHEYYASLEPELRHYLRNRETTTEVALKMGLRDDLYLVLAGLDETGSRATFKVFVNPLQVWLWFGIIIMIFGTGVVLSDKKRYAEN